MKLKLVLIMILITSMVTYGIAAQDKITDNNDDHEDGCQKYVMADIGRISVEIPQNWVAESIKSNVHYLYLEDKIGIVVFKTESDSFVDSLYSFKKMFSLNLKVLSTIEKNISNYSGIVSQCSINGKNADSIATVLNIDSQFVVFFGYVLGYQNDKISYDDMLSAFYKIMNSIESDSSEVGYVYLNNMGKYKIKLQESWTTHFENKKYIFTNDDVFAVIQTKLYDSKEINELISLIKKDVGFTELDLTEHSVKNMEYKNDYVDIFAEGTGKIKEIGVGVFVRVLQYPHETAVVIGFIEYKRFYNDFSLNEEIIEIMKSFSKDKS